MSTTRMAGRRGRLPAKPPAERFAIQYLSSYLTTLLPAPAYPIDVTDDIDIAALRADIDALHGTGG